MRCTGATSAGRDQPPIASVLTPPLPSRTKGTGSAMAQIPRHVWRPHCGVW
jgi:hypothetical protein